MNILEKINKKIQEQVRNGRTEIYLHTDELEELGMTPFKEKGMVYVNIDNLNMLIQTYKDHQEMER